MSTYVVAKPVGGNRYQGVSRHARIPAAAKALAIAHAEHPDAVVAQLVRGGLSVIEDLGKALETLAFLKASGGGRAQAVPAPDTTPDDIRRADALARA